MSQGSLFSSSSTSPKTSAAAAESSDQTAETSEVVVLSVESLNRQIRQLIEGELGLVWVQAEISNFKAHTSGHFYFSLKDSKSQISAVMFRGYNSRLRFKPTDGLEVIVRGRVSVYEPRGSYQIVCEMMEPVGAGALQKAFEQLKEKLRLEGLFEVSRKRAMPALPRHVAIVTSPTGAAIRDMINVLSRRNRAVKITVVPTLVQGEGAASQIVEAMNKAFQLPDVDAIIVGRGGGSIEDLWAFNDEKLARVIASSPVPVISAVGHEIDFTIADFVADLRAPTPSAAAELVVKNTGDLIQRLDSQRRLLQMTMSKILKMDHQRVQGLTARLVDPKRKLQDLILRNDELLGRLNQSVLAYFRHRRMQLHLLQEKMTSPEQLLLEKKSRVDLLQLKMANSLQKLLERRKSQFSRLAGMLDSLSPLKVVERGYSVVMKGPTLVKSVKQLKKHDEILVRLMEGQFTAQVAEIKKEIKREN
ncbi:MAG: exodeoxyribonuclease VII large subunit [Bdellovibrio sp. CG10_big_fil_rev_8_21_14_0_10_47_8]|nr:MAG: exodeoxyribonuclease VII large subunit [Bdellovibrio sp. CG10_big_fil_rev_8_21_14_0_10_47_8]